MLNYIEFELFSFLYYKSPLIFLNLINLTEIIELIQEKILNLSKI